MKYNCVLCKIHGIDKKAEILTKFAGYEISVCQECANKIHPENMILKEIIRNCLDQTLRDEQLVKQKAEEAKEAVMKKEIRSLLKNIYEQSSPSKNGYAYFFPSPNKGKRLLITGWIDPSKAALIAENILLGKKTVDDYDCVEEIDLAFKE